MLWCWAADQWQTSHLQFALPRDQDQREGDQHVCPSLKDVSCLQQATSEGEEGTVETRGCQGQEQGASLLRRLPLEK